MTSCARSRVETWGEDTTHHPPPITPVTPGGMNDRPPVQAEGAPGPHPRPSQVLKVPAPMPPTPQSAGVFLSCTTCSWPVGGHTGSRAQRHPQRTGGVPACLHPAFGCGYRVLPEVPLQPSTNLGRPPLPLPPTSPFPAGPGGSQQYIIMTIALM